MPSERPLNRLRDIVENARAIFRYTEGMDLAAFEKDRKTYDAVEPSEEVLRRLNTIGE